MLLGLSNNAQSHAFGARYDLPLPLWLYLGAAGAAVTVSFVIIARLSRPSRQGPAIPPPQQDHEQTGADVRPAGSGTHIAQATAIAMLFIVITSAFIGADSATGNFATVFVWIVWWVGLVFLQALVADLWRVINPWYCLARIARHMLDKLGYQRRFHYPQALDYWPALAFFAAFAWLELVSELGEQPRTLGVLILLYGAVTTIFACLFGAHSWFTRADPFTVVFTILGRFSSIAIDGGARWRFPGQGLLVREPVPLSMLVLVMTLLATVSFDGFVETPPWAALLDWLTVSENLRSTLLTLQGAGVDLLKLTKTVGLLLAITLFVIVYLSVAWMMDRCSGNPQGMRTSSGSFVLTLVPIAVGYHLAHYLSYLLIAGQLIIPLASDPFNLGWDLLGTRSYVVDIAIVDARFVWYTAVLAIIGGHIIAVYLSHATALRLYKTRAQAVRSQVPMLILMVGYTMSSLWILSQPIVSP